MRRFRLTMEIVDRYNRYDADELRRDIVSYPEDYHLGVEVVDSEAILIESDEDHGNSNRRNP